MNDPTTRILDHLAHVAAERRLRTLDPRLGARVVALKAYQQGRFRRTYDDLLASTRYREAALFFLHELYGPEDFSDRDDQFARIVGPLVRLFPRDLVGTVEDLAALHALSESLDTEMARNLPADSPDRMGYLLAWQATGRAADRQAQIEGLLQVGRSLDRYTRNPVLRHSLRAMRGPAKAAGLASLQSFLEAGFETFRQMKGAAEFLALVRQREEALCRRLFDAGAVAAVTAGPEGDDLLGQLP